MHMVVLKLVLMVVMKLVLQIETPQNTGGILLRHHEGHFHVGRKTRPYQNTPIEKQLRPLLKDKHTRASGVNSA